MQELIQAVIGMREKEALTVTDTLLANDADPMEILESCRRAMQIIGKRFEAGEFFVPELILAGEILKQVSEKIKPRMKKRAGAIQKLGKVVLGTVEGDIHDIAKDIVAFMLDISGFEVIDLGVDVSPAHFVETTKDEKAKIVGLSGFLTLAYDPMKATVEALDRAGLRQKVKVMIGGGQIDDQIRIYTGADAYGRDAMAAVSLATKWIGG